MNLADALLRWNVNKIDVLLHIIEQKKDTRLFILEKRKGSFTIVKVFVTANNVCFLQK